MGSVILTEQSVILKVLTKMVKSRTQSPEVRRRQILDASRALLSQKGYHDIKMDDVASVAKLAKGTLYLHFKDKEQIVRALFEDLMDQQEIILSKVKKTNDLVQLKDIATIKLQFFHDNRDFFSEFMQLKDSMHTANRIGVQKRFQKHMQQMMTVMETVMLGGHIAKSDPFLASFFFMSLIRMFWIKDQIFDEKNTKKSSKSINAEVETLMNLFLNGIQGSKKGKRP